MTIIFNKRTGSIKMVFSGDLQHISTVFGDESEDYSLIYDEITVPDDDTVIHNSKQFQINVDSKMLEISDSADLKKYLTSTTNN